MLDSEKFNNPVCQECIKRHLEKYDGYIDDNKVVYNGFSVPCQGIPVDYLGEKLRALLPKSAQEEALAILDPATWAERWVKLPDGTPWIARWYQEIMLRCTATRRVTRCGRRSGKTDAIAIHILHYCFTNGKKRVLVIAPYKAHVKEIMDRIRSFIASNPKLMASIARDVGSPWDEIKFYNGSRVRAFSSGTKSGSEGVGVRGQDADRIYLDEADYLDEGDLKAITAILATHAHVELWASSTPTGRRAHFWKWCLHTPTYKEFHYPSSVLPHWKEIEAQFRADYAGRQDDWTHEAEAEFGEQIVGVFQNQHVDPAIEDYKYEQMLRDKGWIYSVGVDWNTEAGTEICVTGFNGHDEFKVVEAINIPKQGWTQLAGMQAIIDINAKWRPAFIYADEGAGGTNIELLRKYGFETAHRDLKDPAAVLKDIVKTYNFSSKIEARDPLTRAPIKKHAKPFLVENAVRFFEERRIKISAYDSILRSQLDNYIIKRRTTAGVPVYGVTEEKVGDHRLDAFMLSLIGFKLEMSSFGKPRYSNNIIVDSVGLHRGTRPGQQPTPQEDLKKRLDRVPPSRFADGADDGIIERNNGTPGNVTSHGVKTIPYGWETDEEDKYRLIHRIGRLKKRVARRRAFPKRSTF